MWATLKCWGTVELISERLNSFVRKGAKRSMHSLSKFVGKGSRSHDLFGAARIKVLTCSSVSGLKA